MRAHTCHPRPFAPRSQPPTSTSEANLPLDVKEQPVASGNLPRLAESGTPRGRLAGPCYLGESAPLGSQVA